MGLADGDLYVSGSILSYQQMIRIYTNFRGASVPSALKAGALWSKSSDDRLYHQGVALDEVFTEKTTLTWENLLSNSGFGVWSQSDASKGTATITYDQGAKGAGAAPSVGDAVVGGTSGATAKVVSYTTATGAWATNDATGVVIVGAVSHDFAFVDNETITFGGVETAVVNMPDSAVQVGKVQNGGFATDTDPPPGWTAADSTLTTEAGGKVGNCMRVTASATPGWATQDMTVEVGKIYKLSFYYKVTAPDVAQWYLYDSDNAAFIKAATELADTAGAWSSVQTLSFEAPAGCTTIQLALGGKTDTDVVDWDEVTCYEITPCCTAADGAAFDGWNKDSTLDLYRQHDDGGTLTKDGSFYSLVFVPTAVNDYMYWPLGIPSLAEHYQKFAGRTVTFGCWAKTSTASHFYLRIADGVSDTDGSFHTGGGAWEWLEVTKTMAATPTTAFFAFRTAIAPATDGDTVVYISQPIAVFGSHIGEGNYQPIKHEILWMDKKIISNALDSLTTSDVGVTTLNMEADSDALLPKGIKAWVAALAIRDSGSLAVSNTYLRFRYSLNQLWQFTQAIAGFADDARARTSQWQACNSAGDVQYQIDASGVGTCNIQEFHYTGVQLN